MQDGDGLSAQNSIQLAQLALVEEEIKKAWA